MIAVAVLALLAGLAPQSQDSSGRTDLEVAGRRVQVESRQHVGRLYLRLRDLRPLGLSVNEPQSDRLRVEGPGGSVTLRLGSSLVRESGRMTLLSGAVRDWDGEWFVPEDFIDRIAVALLDAPPGDAAAIDPVQTRVQEVEGLRIEVRRDRVELRLRTRQPLEVSDEGRWLSVRVPRGDVPERLGAAPPNPILTAVVPTVDEAVLELRLVKGPAFSHFESAAGRTEQSLVLFGSVGPADSTAAAGVAPRRDPDALDRRSCAVVLDPGHGGIDRGVLSGGVAEKDLTLALALDVQDVLQRRGMCCQLLRNRDIALGLEQRSAAANHHQPAVVVSLHVTVTGEPGIYVQADTPGSVSRRLRRWEQAQKAHASGSRRLAGLLQDALQRSTGSGGQMVAVPLTLLAPMDAPAALLEIPADRLREAGYPSERANRTALADAIGGAILSFLGVRSGD